MVNKLFIVVCLLVLPFAAKAENVITAVGMGTVDLTVIKNKAQAKMMAKRAAKIDALRQLTEQVKGVQLTGGTTVEEMEVSSDVIATRVKGLIKGAFELDKKLYEEAGSYVAEVELGICVDDKSEQCKGRNTLNKATEDNG